MTNNSFEKISASDKCLYGLRRLLMCGFPAAAQTKFNTLLKMIGFNHVPVIWVLPDQADALISALIDLPHASGEGCNSDLPRAIIAAGITENEFLGLMSACKKSGMAQTLWATLTPTSERWTISKLLAELAAERAALNQKL